MCTWKTTDGNVCSTVHHAGVSISEFIMSTGLQADTLDLQKDKEVCGDVYTHLSTTFLFVCCLFIPLLLTSGNGGPVGWTQSDCQ